MQLPDTLEKLLAAAPGLHAGVLQTLTEFRPWLEHSQLPFFPEYTDHGPDHIEKVLQTANAIIKDEARAATTPADAAVLSISVLLHDSALHLSEASFLSLVYSGESRPISDLLGDEPWNSLWENFLAASRRLDAKQLVRLFGDPEPARRPPRNWEDWTYRDRVLIGDFIRRHHHRIAHEFAVFGVPSPPGNARLTVHLPEDLADLAGVIARSHGTPARASFDYLDAKFDRREFRGVHPVFLMVLLRVSDYLQVQSDRAPGQVLQVRQLRSPFSRGEWRTHHAVRDIRTTHEDPEAVFVQAMPEDVETFLKLRSLLGGLQAELDTSWAVLGEVYGRYKGPK